MYRSPQLDHALQQELAQQPAQLVSVDRGNGTTVAVTEREGALVGFVCSSATAQPLAHLFDDSSTVTESIEVAIPVVQQNQGVTHETFIMNPPPEDLSQSHSTSVGDVELGSTVYVAQHLMAIDQVIPADVCHVRMVFGCPFSVWRDEQLREALRRSMEGVHQFRVQGRDRVLLVRPILFPQPIMAAANITVPQGKPNKELIQKLVAVIDVGTGTDDHALVRGFKTVDGRAGGDSGNRSLAVACETLWNNVQRDSRFAMLKRAPFPGTHALLHVLDTKKILYDGNYTDVHSLVEGALRKVARSNIGNLFSDHVWGKRWNEIACVGGASGGTAQLWPYICDEIDPMWKSKLQLIEPHIHPLRPDPLHRHNAVYAVAVGGYYTVQAKDRYQQMTQKASVV